MSAASRSSKMILITGAGGFLGSRLMKTMKNVKAAPSLQNKTKNEIQDIILDSQADVIINTAAIADTGICEKDPEASYHANVEIPLYIAEVCEDKKLICFSSDQVYNGSFEKGPYTEDMAAPASVYARHKYEMEQKVLSILPSAVILRAEWMYDQFSDKPNYFRNVINAGKTVSFSSGQYRGITYVREAAENMEKVITLPGGVYNFGSETKLSMYEITEFFLKELNRNTILTDSEPRHNLWMDHTKIKKYGIEFSDVCDGLIRCAGDNGLL